LAAAIATSARYDCSGVISSDHTRAIKTASRHVGLWKKEVPIWRRAQRTGIITRLLMDFITTTFPGNLPVVQSVKSERG